MINLEIRKQVKLALIKPYLFTCRLVFFLICMNAMQSYSQDTKSTDSIPTISEKDEAVLLRADELFELKNYVEAMALFDTLSHHYPQSVLFKFKTGICFLHTSSKHDKALVYLKDVKERMPELQAIDYYLARAYLYNYYYDEAIKYFTIYAEKPAARKEVKFNVKHFIEYCEHGKVILKEPLHVYIDNLGKPVNTDNSEYVPVISSDESFMIYTYRGERSKGGKQDANNRPDPQGEYYEDIFITYRVGKHWLDPEPLGNINTNDHDAAIALSVDGQKLFIFKATKKDKGDIYISTLKGYDWSTPQRLNANINTNYWEGSITMTADEKCIYFSSDRPGGLGGRDLYKSYKQANGDWGPAINLGPGINTQYNEDAPFVHPNNKLFYFSSEGHNSIGGYDIFKSELIKDSLTPPQNVGFPINTSTDDKYISISTNGAHAYYSSGVEEGLGQQDIYSITPGIPGRKPQVAIIKGFVTGNEKPISAKISVTSKNSSSDFGTFYSNSETGKYLLVLLPFNSYKISFEAEGYKTHNEYVNTASLKSSVELEEHIHLYSDDFKLARIESKDTVGFIYTHLEEELSSLDSLEFDDNHLLLVAREREEERAMNIPTNSTSFRIATAETIKRILAQNALIAAESKPQSIVDDTLVALKIVPSSPDSTSKSGNEIKSNTDQQGLVANDNARQVNNSNLEEQKTNQENGNASNSASDSGNLSESGVAKEKKSAENKSQQFTGNASAMINRDALNQPTYGIYYKVQIGAYRKPQNFKYKKYEDLGSVELLKLEDGITRFTIGNFETLAEAERLQNAVIQRGIKDAWITATVNGERKFLQDVKPSLTKVIN